MKLLDIVNDIVKEGTQHISPHSRGWAKFIYDQVKNTKDREVVIFGQETPELYKNFPVDYFVININPNFGMGAAYDENQSGYKEGKYYVYLILSKTIEPYVLNHELRHAFEDYKRISGGGTSVSNSKEGINLFSGDFTYLLTDKIYGDKNIQKGSFGIFPNVIRALYLTSKLEETAYGESVYDNQDWVIRNLKDVLKINYTNDSNGIAPERIQRWWDNFKRDVNIPIITKFNNYKSFLAWADKTIQNRGEKVLKKFLKMKYIRQNEKGMK